MGKFMMIHDDPLFVIIYSLASFTKSPGWSPCLLSTEVFAGGAISLVAVWFVGTIWADER
jgi:hypothetical protein